VYFRWEIADPDRSNQMTDVTFTIRRADSSANEDLAKLARHGADTFGYKAHLRIDRQLAQLLRLRVSQINNCAYYLDHKARVRVIGRHEATVTQRGGVRVDRNGRIGWTRVCLVKWFAQHLLRPGGREAPSA
jgi:AhpD family alkylhydroperoxidase